MLILHYTGMRTAQEALERLADSAAQVSAHYVIDEDGSVLRLVAEERRAWHAGKSFWSGETDINGCSIGIELVNPGHEFGYRAFPEAQMASLVMLAGDIVRRHRIPPERVLGHSDVAPLRKQDPGELFDWPRLARAGIGLWPDLTVAPPLKRVSVRACQEALGAIGYGVRATGRMNVETRAVVAAFQRHFRPDCVDGGLDEETARRIEAVRKALSPRG